MTLCEGIVDPCVGVGGGASATTFSAVLQFLAHSQCLLTEPWPPQANLHNGSNVDIIIVGSGTAGSALAARLAETNLTVLLLEAGDDPPLDSIVPGFLKSLRGSPYDWNFTLTDQPDVGQELRVPHERRINSGYILGGTGSINAMIYARGFPANFDQWADTVGDSNWNWNNVFPYFKKTERMTDKSILNSDWLHLHGRAGEIQISGLDKQSVATSTFLDSFAEINFNIVVDRNNPENLSGRTAYRQSYTIKEGKRQSTVTAMLNKMRSRNNLHVLKNALVTKILIKNNTAYGVKVLIGTEEWEFYANKEVIVSAGVYNTPKLLLLSGIGPKKYLQTTGIELVKNLPVGTNLQELYKTFIFLAAESDLCPSDELSSFYDVIRYLYNRTGSLSIPSNMVADYILPGSPTPNLPDYGIFPSCVPKGSDFLEQCLHMYEYTHETCSHLNAINEVYELFPIAIAPRRLKSKGVLKLASVNPLDKPLIYSGTFTDEKDLEGVPEVIEVVRSLVNTSYFKSKNAFIVDLKFKSCEGLEWPEYEKCIVKSTVHSESNGVGTAAMGSVVDTRLRVLGVQKLRVVDASVIPSGIQSLLNTIVVMIAEKAADFIKEDYGLLQHYHL